MSFHSRCHGCLILSSHGIRIITFFLLLCLLSPEIHFAAAQTPSSIAQTEPYPYNHLSLSVANIVVLVVILIAALFLMALLSIYTRYCSDSANNGVRPLGGAAGRSRRAPRGLDPAVMETFPTLEYSEVKVLKKGALECAVCLSEFEDAETLRLRVIPKCDHVFHPECIDKWLVSHTTCPVCRANLVPQPGESVRGVPELTTDSEDIEAQNGAVEPEPELQNKDLDRERAEPEVMRLNRTLNRNHTRRSRSSRTQRFPRSHSTGHSMVQQGEDTERFTLRLPVEARNRILNRMLHGATSLGVLPRECSSRRGYRTNEGSRNLF